MAHNFSSIPELYLHASKLLNEGRYQQAAALFQKVLALDPKNAAAALQLARILLRANQPLPARNILESVQSFAQSNFELLHMLGALQLQSGASEKALTTITQALTLRADFAPTLNIKGNILLEQNRLDEAIETFKHALEIDATQVDPHNNIAWAYRALGKKEQAIAHFKAAYQLDNRVTEALSGILLLQTNEHDSEAVTLAVKQLTRNDLPLPQRVELNFSLGKAMEDCRNYQAAFSYFDAGNRLWRDSHPYSIEQDKTLFLALKQAFDPARISTNTHNEKRSNTPTPIFIVGMPRSSTSLVEQILASHSLVTGAGELSALSQLLTKGKTLTWEPSRTQEVREHYLAILTKHSDGKPYVVDKMPQNFRFVGILLECFPEAKVIHCQRDARDNCLSLFKHHFPMTSHAYAYEANELAQYHLLYQDLMAFWEENTAGRMLNLSYETLVDDFDNQLSGILQYVGLEYEDGCKNFHQTQRAIRTASSDQVRRGLYKSGVDQWKHYEKELSELFERVVKDN